MAYLERPDGGLIYYELIEGREDLPALIFLHEGLGCTEMWKDYPAKLCAATGCTGLIYDRAGYGKSSPDYREHSIHYLHEAALCELPYVIESTIGGKDHILVGHSDGGSIALIYASERCPFLCGVITEAAHVFVEDVTLEGIDVALSAYEAGKLKRALAYYHADNTDRMFWGWARPWSAPWFRKWNLEYALPAIQVPVYALQGVEDQYGTPAQVTAIVAGNPQRRGLIIDGSGHVPHNDQPEVLIDLMSEFIAGII